jgi:hypothetical protein
MQSLDTTIAMDPRYYHCIEQVPAIPEAPQFLRDKVATQMLPGTVSLAGAMDLQTVELLAFPEKRAFRQSCPAKLALAIECSQQGVVVGHSFLGQRALGLYPTKDFNKGDIIFFGLSNAGVLGRHGGGGDFRADIAMCVPGVGFVFS